MLQLRVVKEKNSPLLVKTFGCALAMPAGWRFSALLLGTGRFHSAHLCLDGQK